MLTDRLGALLAGGLLAVSGGARLGHRSSRGRRAGARVRSDHHGSGAAPARRARHPAARRLAGRSPWARCCRTKSLEAPIIVPVVLVLLAPGRVRGSSPAPRHHRPAARRRRRAQRHSWCSSRSRSRSGSPMSGTSRWSTGPMPQRERDIPATAAKLVSTLWDRDLALLFVAAVALGLRGRGAGAAPASARTAVVDDDATWASHRSLGRRRHVGLGTLGSAARGVVAGGHAACGSSVVVSPLWRPHVAAVSIPLVLVIAPLPPAAATAARGRGRRRTAGRLATRRPAGDRATTRAPRRELVAALERAARGRLGDQRRTGRRVAGRCAARTDDLVDPSMLRRQQDRYTEDVPGPRRRGPPCLCIHPHLGTAVRPLRRPTRPARRTRATSPTPRSATARCSTSGRTAPPTG